MAPKIVDRGPYSPKATMYYGEDARDVMDDLAENSVHTIVACPPYWSPYAYSYGDSKVWGGNPDCVHQWESQTCTLCGAWRGELSRELNVHLYVDHLVEIFRGFKKPLRDDGIMWLTMGDQYLKEDTENENPDMKLRDLIGIPWELAFALRKDGWYLRQDIIWNKTNVMPSGIQDLCRTCHEYVFMFSKSPYYFYDRKAIQEDSVTGGKRNRKTVWTLPNSRYPKGGVRAFGDKKKLAEEQESRDPNAYTFGNMPDKLLELMILAGTSNGGCCSVCGKPRTSERKLTCECPKNDLARCVVMDPFSGLGTTGKVAVKHGRDYIGIDIIGHILDRACEVTMQDWVEKEQTIFDVLG